MSVDADDGPSDRFTVRSAPSQPCWKSAVKKRVSRDPNGLHREPRLCPCAWMREATTSCTQKMFAEANGMTEG
jgi:hypothetical protein